MRVYGYTTGYSRKVYKTFDAAVDAAKAAKKTEVMERHTGARYNLNGARVK